MGTHPEDGAGPGNLSSQGRATDHRETTNETGEWELGVPAIGGDDGGSGIRGDKKVYHKEAVNGGAVYCDATNYGTL